MTAYNEAASLSATSNILEFGGLAELKRQAKAGDPAANKVVAKQFEALFLQMVLKSMRDATPREGLFDSQQSRMFESLLDQQLSQTLGGSNRGTGLAAMIEAQMTPQQKPSRAFDGPLPLRRAAPEFRLRAEKTLPLSPNHTPGSPPVAGFPAPPSKLAPQKSIPPPEAAATGQRSFVDRLMPAAVAAERSTGIPAHFMVAQAALETGWGKSEPIGKDGQASYNIFGIKAGPTWRGPVAEASTTEVIGGLAQTRIERFRVYGSREEAFRDYASLLLSEPRYAALRGEREPARFARGLQAAGYATDPRYADKLERIIGGVNLRQVRAA